VARESTLHCKLDSQLHGAAVRSIFWVGGKWIKEIPVNNTPPLTFDMTRSEMLNMVQSCINVVDSRGATEGVSEMAMLGVK
jgi:hypothetical protein